MGRKKSASGTHRPASRVRKVTQPDTQMAPDAGPSLADDPPPLDSRANAETHAGPDHPYAEPVSPDAAPALIEAAPPEASVQIDIDPTVPGGFIHNRFDLQVRGRIVSTVAIESVEILVDAQPVARIQYAPTRSTPRLPSPDGKPLIQQAFQVSLPGRQDRTDPTRHILVRAHTIEGQTHDQAFDLAIDPAGPKRVTVLSGPTTPMRQYPDVRPPIVLYVERALLDQDGNLLVKGWSIAATSVVTVQGFIGDEERLPAARIGGRRDDVAKVYAAYSNAHKAGFVLATRLAPGKTDGLTAIRIQSISLDGCSQSVTMDLEAAASAQETPQAPTPPAKAGPTIDPSQLDALVNGPAALDAVAEPPPAARPGTGATTLVAPPPEQPQTIDSRRKIHFFCDEAQATENGSLLVKGWAVCAVGIADIEIHLDGARIGTADLAMPRPDVGQQYAAIPMARLSGFRFDHAVPDLAEGEHRMRIVLRNGMDDTAEETKVVHVSPVVAKPAPPKPAHPKPASRGDEFLFQLDSPKLKAGAAVEPVSGRLTIDGWVLAVSGVAGIDIYLNEQRLGEAHYGLVRQDVAVAFPDRADSLRCGYAFHCPPRALRNGTHVFKLVVRARNGAELTQHFEVEVRTPEGGNPVAAIRRRVNRVEANLAADVLRDLDYHPRFHLLLRQPTPIAADQVRATIDSLRHQSYENWHLDIHADTEGADTEGANAVAALLASSHESDLSSHITLIRPTDAPSPTPTDDQRPLWYGLLRAGDELGCNALAEFALAGGLHRQADFLYADEARISPASNEREPFFKPDFSPDLLLSTNYIGRPWFATGALLQPLRHNARGTCCRRRIRCGAALTEQADAVHHVPKLLARRGAGRRSTTIRQSRAALAKRRHAPRLRGRGAEPACLPGTYRLRRTQVADRQGLDHHPDLRRARLHRDLHQDASRQHRLSRTSRSSASTTSRTANATGRRWLPQNADKIVDIPGAFNWSRFNNRAVDATDGEFLLFLNDDIEITHADWLDALLEHAQRPEVGVVGPQLLYPDRTVQHAGMFLGARHRPPRLPLPRRRTSPAISAWR